MIVYGSRMYFKKNVVKSFGECEHCGRYSKQSSYQGRKFGHLYFIPLIPAGPTSQIMNECSSCSMGAHIPLTDAEPMVESLREKFKDWINKIQDGVREVHPESGGEPVNIGMMIAGTVDTLYCLGEIRDVDAITQILDASGMEFEKSLVLGRWSELRGDLKTAIGHYRSAAANGENDAIAWYQVGKAEALNGNAMGAVEAYEKYLEKHPDDIGVLAQLASVFEKKKDYTNIIRTYDRLYSLHPDFLVNKPMKKTYKKACKKCRVEGKFLAQL